MALPELPDLHTKPEEKTRHAPRYKVFIHNDDKTPMDFVVFILGTIFSRKGPDAERIMMEGAVDSAVTESSGIFLLVSLK